MSGFDPITYAMAREAKIPAGALLPAFAVDQTHPAHRLAQLPGIFNRHQQLVRRHGLNQHKIGNKIDHGFQHRINPRCRNGIVSTRHRRLWHGCTWRDNRV